MADERLGYPDARLHKPHRVLVNTAGGRAEALAMVSGTDQTFFVDVHGCRYVTIRGKTTTSNATLVFAFCRPGLETTYTTGNPSNVTLTAGTENDSGEITVGGQSRLKITLTPAGNGTLDYLDVMSL